MFGLISDYTKWHYSYALVAIVHLAQEFARFFFNLFSVGLFLRSLFSPIFSISLNDVASPEVSDVVAVFMGGVFTRIIGACVRTFFILVGLLSGVVSVIVFSFIGIVWILLPIIFPALIYVLGVVSFSLL